MIKFFEDLIDFVRSVQQNYVTLYPTKLTSYFLYDKKKQCFVSDKVTEIFEMQISLEDFKNQLLAI